MLERKARSFYTTWIGSLKNSPLLCDQDRTLAVAGVIISILIVIFGVVIGKFVYSVLGGLVIIACALWLVVREYISFESHHFESRAMTISSAIGFFGLYTLSNLSIYLRPEIYERPLLYFVLIALMAGIIAYEIFTSSRQHTGLILIQIILLGVSIAWSQLLIFPDLLGIDPWHHSAFTDQIIEGGNIPDGYGYSKLPLFHLTIAATSLSATLPYKFATMASVSLGQIICSILFVFLATNYIFKNYQTGLLAALLVTIANHHIFMSYWSIPNAFAAVFIVVALYSLLFRFDGGLRPVFAVLCTIALASIILTHTIAAMCMAILLFVIWGALVMYRFSGSPIENHVPLLVPVSFTMATLAWWTFVSGSIDVLIDMLQSGFRMDYFIDTPMEFRVISMPFGEEVFINLGMFLFFAFALIGTFYMVSRRGNSSTFALAWAGMAPLIIGFSSLALGLAVIEHRWWYIAQILLSIPLAIAIHTVGMCGSKSPGSRRHLIAGAVIILGFLMVMSPAANIDNAAFAPNTTWRATLIESELHAQTILDRYEGTSMSDVYYSLCLTYLGHETETFCEEVSTRDLRGMGGNLVLIRDTILRDPFMLFSTSYKLSYDLRDSMNVAGFHQIYDSSSVYAYLR